MKYYGDTSTILKSKLLIDEAIASAKQLTKLLVRLNVFERLGMAWFHIQLLRKGKFGAI